MSRPSFVSAALLPLLATLPLLAAPPAAPRKRAPARVDCFGDPLPPGAVARLGTMRLHHSHCATFSPDGKLLATAGAEAIRLWETATGKEVRRLVMPPNLVSTGFPTPTLTFSRDGRKLAACHEVGIQVAVWQIDNPKPLFTSFVKRSGMAHLLQSSCITFSLDGRMLFTGDDRSVHGWDVATGREVFHHQHSAWNKTRVTTIVFTRDGKRFATASQHERAVRVWETRTGRLLHILRGHKGTGVHAVAFSPDGRVLATGGDDHSARLWDVKRGKEIRRLDGPRSTVVAVAFAPNGKELALTRVQHASSISPRTSTIHLWDVGGVRKRPRTILNASAAGAVAYSPDGKTLAWVQQGQTVHLLDAATGAERLPFASHTARVNDVAYSPDGRLIATASDDGTIRLWAADTGRPQGVLRGHRDAVKSVAFSPDGKQLASASVDKSAALWDLATRSRRCVIDCQGVEAHAVVFTPDGKTLVWRGKDRSLHFHDVRTQKEIRSLREDAPGDGGAVARSADGRLLAVGSNPGQGQIALFRLDAGSGKRMQTVDLDDRFLAVALSPDGRTLACNCSWKTVLWEVATGKVRARLPGSRSLRGAVAFSPDGRFLACGGLDLDSSRSRPVTVWELASGRELGAFVGHAEPVHVVAFSPDGKRLTTVSDDLTTLVWDLDAIAQRGPHPIAGEWPARKTLTEDDLDFAWMALAGGSAAQAQQAIWSLAGTPALSVPFLRNRLGAMAGRARRIAALTEDLDSDRYMTREKASAELKRLGSLAEPALRRTLATNESPEVRRRVRFLLARMRTPLMSDLRDVRAVEALEQMGTRAARELLRELAGGDERARLTREAKESLARLARRTAS